ESALRVVLVTPMRVRRFFHDERERRVFAEKTARGELAPYIGEADAAGFWIERAARVDTGLLIAAMRGRLRAAGRLREERVEAARERARRDLVGQGRDVDVGAGGRGPDGGGVGGDFK
ncbi:MAG: hypothetical protein MUE42_15055, partial [Opitutaceae bacterium]|nr:hypothetical protein [Opitutaceae bacterium]